MSLYVNSGGSWALVPQEPDKIFVNSGGTWADATEVWVSQEVTPGTFQWTKAWRVPTPPAGVTPDLQQLQILGGDVEASWTNNNTEYAILVEFEINSVSWGTVAKTAGSTSATLAESELSNGDEVRARMRYYEGAVQGTWSAWSSTLTYVA